MNKNLWSVVLALVIVVGGCAPTDPDVEAVDPEVHYGFDDPVTAIGNSLTAGFTSGGLVLNGQLQGYANLVANQFLAGISDAPPVVAPGLPKMAMSLPLVQSGIGSESGFGLLYVAPTGALTRDPLPAPPTELLLASALLQPYANLGVPGALTIDVTTRTTAEAPAGIPLPPNPFFDIVLRNSALPFDEGEPVSAVTSNGTQLGQYLQIVASPYSTTALTMLWIGNNDILGRATAGTDAVEPASEFQNRLTPIVEEIDAGGVPMVAIATIPRVTSAPYFTAVVGLLMQNGLSPAALNTDEADVALILLPSQSLLFPGGVFDPEYLAPDGSASLPANLTLTATEVQNLGVAVAEYNAVIAGEASARGWALVDVDAALAALPTDPGDPDFGTLNAVYPFVPPFQNAASAFSLDGIHPSEKGYARVANLFIDAINAAYGPVLAALRGGPMDAVDEGAVQNIIGFEQYTPPPPRTAPTALVVDESARRGLERVIPR